MIRRFFLLAALFILTLTSGCVPTLIPTLVPDTALPVDADAQPVIIDTDMAADDWLAILYLLGQPDLDILAITVTGAGEAHCDAGTQNALDLALLAGRPDIPVSCGRETPLVGNHVFPEEWRKAVDAMFWLSLPVSDRKVADETAVGMLTRIIRESPQKVHVITLGPLTNLAEALNADPGLVENLEMITIMGGAVDVPGNVGTSSSIQNQTAEWNFYVDPQAALDVLEAGAPITLVPLDATNDAPFTPAFYLDLKKDRGTAMAEFVHRVMEVQEEQINTGKYYFWDPLAAAIADGEVSATFEEMTLSVVVAEGADSGRTLRSADGFPVRVAVDIEREQFYTLFLDGLNQRIP